MSFLSSLLGRSEPPRGRIEPRFLAASPENPAVSLSTPGEWLTDWSTGGNSQKWGPTVSERSAMAVSAVYRSVSIISGMIAELPLKVYKRTPDGREEARDHPLAAFFRVAPYPGRAQTAFSWRELWSINELLWGNHYSVIRRDGAARVIGFEPLMPWNVTVFRNNYRNVYRCLMVPPTTTGTNQPTIEYHDQEDIVHIPGPGFDGITGMSRIRAFARNAVSLSAVLEDQTGYVHENAAKPSAFVTPGKRMTPDTFRRFRNQFDVANTGRGNAGRVIYGEDGATYTPMQMAPEDLNTIEARRYQIADISRFFGVPLHLLNETDKSTSWGSGLTEQTIALGVFTLNPELGRIEAELNYKLFDGTDYYIEFDRQAMLAMDPVKSAEVARTEIASGVLSINERRRQLNRPPVENGDRPLINSANVSLDALFAPGAQPRQVQAAPPDGA